MRKVFLVLFLVFNLSYAKEEVMLSASNAYTLTMQEASGTEGLVSSAKAIIIYPSVKKLGFVIGGLYGDGVAMIRNGSSWKIYSSEIVNASIGFQIGYEDNYMVLFVMNDKTLNSMFDSRLKLGADATVSVYKASASIGAVDLFDQDIYVFVSKAGAFAGASIGGFVVSIDGNKQYRRDTYGYDSLIQTVDGR
ncbi:MAG: lipid-binding SYLF domain-containing protein [Campylobacteraceae bacterium]|nr:lipid-binding SYLF domain-containing protein [Campylobacteraceae bacterium]